MRRLWEIAHSLIFCTTSGDLFSQCGLVWNLTVLIASPVTIAVMRHRKTFAAVSLDDLNLPGLYDALNCISLGSDVIDVVSHWTLKSITTIYLVLSC